MATRAAESGEALDPAAILRKYAPAITRVNCPFCGADDSETLLTRERHGTGMTTAICRRCSLAYLRERWPDDVYARFYEHEFRILDPMKATTEERHARALAGAGRYVDVVAPFLPGPDGVVLDVGASSGAVLEVIRWATGCTVVGIDPSEEESAFGRARGVDVRQGTLGTVDLDEASFDLVLVIATIDHLFDPFGDLRRIRGLLKPGGFLFVSVSDFIEKAKLRPDPAQLDHLTYYTSETLRSLVQQTGFEAVRWQASSLEEALLRHPDIRDNVGHWLSIDGVFRVADEPIRWPAPDWRVFRDRLGAALRRHERGSLPQRVLRRALRSAGVDTRAPVR